MEQVDAAIVGCGAAGKPLAVALADAGFTVAVIERSKRMYGGACLNTACLPSKMLVHAGEHERALGGDFPTRADRYQAVIIEKNEKTALIRDQIRRLLANHPRIELIDGEASFSDATHLVVRTEEGERHLEAARTFIDTGSVPRIPGIPGVEGGRVYTSESLLDVETLPERVVIIGAGYVGLEFASLFADFGVAVTMLQSGNVFLPHEDADIAAAVRQNLKQRGIRLVLEAKIERIEDEVVQSLVFVIIDGKEERIPGDLVLVATGRRPATDNLNAEAAGVQRNGHGGIVVDKHLRTTASNIWAMGDAVGGLQFTYVSYDDYRIVASSILGDGTRTTENRGAVPSCIFADPPLARVGMTEQEARDAGFDVVTSIMSYDDLPKPHLLGLQAVLMKGVVDRTTDRILGIHLYCSDAPEIINLAKIALDEGWTAADMRNALFTHPTLAEELNNLFLRIPS